MNAISISNTVPKCRDVVIDPGALDALFQEWNRSDQPGIVAGVTHPCAGSWRGGVGVASVELPLVNTPRTRMRIGSVTKMFTGLSVLLLAEQGLLSIDDCVRRYLPELPDWAEKMSLRHFMNHTSGMRCHIDLLYNTGNLARPMPRDVALSVLTRQTDVNFLPGERFCYNNGAYDLLALIVERVSGLDFADFLATYIFTPIGMTDSALKRYDSDMLPGSASLHVRDAAGGFERGYFGAPLSGGGGIVSTADDMLLWLAHMRHPVVGSAETWAAMMKPGVLNDDRDAGYAAGLTFDTYRGHSIVHHSGAVIGGLCMCIAVPDLELGVIVIANRDDVPVMRLATQMIDACIGGTAPPRMGPPDGACISGTFCGRESGTVVQLCETDEKPEALLFGAKLPLRREADGFCADDPLLDVRLELLGGTGAIRLVRRGSIETLDRVAQTAEDPQTAARLCGTYFCEDVEATATITSVDGKMLLRMAGPFGRDDYTLARISDWLWLSGSDESAPVFAASLEFQEQNGMISSFALSTGRTWHLPFVRVVDQSVPSQ